MEYKSLVIPLILLMLAQVVYAEQVGPVDTVFKVFRPDYKIVVEVFDDSDVTNAACCVGRVGTSGIGGGLGLVENTSDAAISCQQAGPVELSDRIRSGKAQGEVVFKKHTSLVLKSLQIVRFYDTKRSVLAYLTCSDKVIDGSPRNTISAVPIIPWRQ